MIRARHIILVTIPYVAALFILHTATTRTIPLNISEAEREVYRYERRRETAPQPVFQMRPPIAVPSGFTGPLRALAVAADTATPGDDVPAYRLTSILISKKIRKAIVNDILLEEGDRLSGMTVDRILDARVRIRQNGRFAWLSLEKP